MENEKLGKLADGGFCMVFIFKGTILSLNIHTYLQCPLESKIVCLHPDPFIMEYDMEINITKTKIMKISKGRDTSVCMERNWNKTLENSVI